MDSHSTTFHLVRHGETVHNVEGRLQGWCDSPLTREGVTAVRETAERLRGRDFVAAYTSTSLRAVTTAEQLLEHHPSVPLRALPQLRELGFGGLEGTREVDLLPTIDPVGMWAAVVGGTFEGFPGGETGPTFRARVLRAFAAIEAAHPSGEVLVVSHCLTLMTYLAAIDPTSTAVPRNAGVSVVEVGPAGRLLRSVDARRPAPTALAASR